MATVQVPVLVAISAATNSTGSATLAIGGDDVRFPSIGHTSPHGWTFVGVVVGAPSMPTTAVFERDFHRWGLLAIAQHVGAPLKLVRKGVGALPHNAQQRSPM